MVDGYEEVFLKESYLPDKLEGKKYLKKKD